MHKQTLSIAEFKASTPFEKFVLDSLSTINSRLKFKNPTPQGDYLTPYEVCEIIIISKGKFYQMVRDGVLTTIKIDPKGRKTLVLRSQVEHLFPKDFIKN
jgi:excisionase family DNA binding protein